MAAVKSDGTEGLIEFHVETFHAGFNPMLGSSI